MKTLKLLLPIFIFGIKGFTQVKESFSDGNFISNPNWQGNAESWIVNSNHQIQSSNSTANSTYYLSTSNTLATTTQWEFFARLNFNTSSANYIDVYLIASDSALYKNSTTGYFIRIGNTEDEVALYRKDAGVPITKIIDGVNGVTNNSDNTLKIKVTRNANNEFYLFRDSTGTGNNYLLEGSFIDAKYTTSTYFGILVKQSTSSFFNKHYFDDITIQPYVPDVTPPTVQSVTATSINTVDVLFSEPVERKSSQTASNYLIEGIGSPVTALKDNNNASLIHLTFAKEFIYKNYSLIISNVKDLAGNSIVPSTTNFSYYTIQTNDIVINEILFNPKPNGADYVELYNKSNQAVNINRLYIGNRNSSGAISSLKKLSDTTFLIAPNSYVVFTSDIDALQRNYLVKNSKAVLILPSLPSFPDTEGTVVLTNKEGTVIDEVHYSEDWHFALIRDKQGISLERIAPQGNSQVKNNWHSAASTAGYGTPGYQNSQYKLTSFINAAIEITPKVFSPDGDGYNDIATIQYNVSESGYVANLTIFDASGRLVRHLVKNAVLGLKGSWNWDGLDEKGQKLAIGPYIIYAELFNLQGKKEQFKQTVVLARRLN